MFTLTTQSTPLWTEANNLKNTKTPRAPWLQVPKFLSPACARAWHEAYHSPIMVTYSKYDKEEVKLVPCWHTSWSMDLRSVEGVFRSLRLVSEAWSFGVRLWTREFIPCVRTNPRAPRRGARVGAQDAMRFARHMLQSLVQAEFPGLVTPENWKDDVVGVGAMCDEIEDAVPGSPLAKFLRGSLASPKETRIIWPTK